MINSYIYIHTYIYCIYDTPIYWMICISLTRTTHIRKDFGGAKKHRMPPTMIPWASETKWGQQLKLLSNYNHDSSQFIQFRYVHGFGFAKVKKSAQLVLQKSSSRIQLPLHLGARTNETLAPNTCVADTHLGTVTADLFCPPVFDQPTDQYRPQNF